MTSHTINKTSNKIKEHGSFIFGFLIIFCIVFLILGSVRGKNITNQFFDPLRTTDEREDVIIVGIDDKSLQSIGAWPWDRKVFASLTKKLNDFGARTVVYDVLFLEPRAGDAEFKDIIGFVKTPVILGSKLENDKYLASHLTLSSALINVEPDSDGKVRRYPTSFLNNGICVYPLARSAFNIAIFNKESNCDTVSATMFRYLTKVPIYSVVDIISGKIPADKIKGKTVFVGSVSLDLLDHFVGMTGEKVPGVFVHASVLTSLLNKVNDRNTNTSETIFLILAYMLVTGLLMYRLKNIIGQIVSLIILIASAALLSVFLFSLEIQIPTPWILLTIFLTGGYITLYRFIKEQKKNAYIQSIFAKYVHKDVLKELMESSSSINFAGEKREISVLFSDIRGFTTFSEKMTPEELTKLLNAYLSAMTPVILEEKGTIDKFIGDAIMAFWNAPLYVENHTTHAVKAAIGMQQALADFNKNNNTELAMGVGVNYGEVIVGNVGSLERVNYTVLGDAVNLASRVEGLTKKYGVLIIVTEEVKNLVNETDIIFRKLDVITVKGKSKPTILYEVQKKSLIVSEIFKKYENAFTNYQAGRFDEAEIVFTELSSNGDGPSKTMLERIPNLKNTNWDGIWHFDEK